MQVVQRNLVGPDHIFRTRFSTTATETDPHFQARLGFYFAIAQELAGLHSAWARLSLPETLRMGKTWVVLRTRIHVNRYTNWAEDVMGETWIEPPKGLHFMRCIRGLDEDDKTLFEGISTWAYLDVANQRPIRPGEVIDDFPAPLETDTRHVYPFELPHRAPMWGSSDPRELYSGSPVINLTDTDGNHHVNNLSYVSWSLNVLPHSFLMAYKVRDIDVSWIKQTYLDDRITVHAGSVQEDPFHQEQPELFFKIVRHEKDGSQTIVFEGYSQWEKREKLTRDGLYVV